MSLADNTLLKLINSDSDFTFYKSKKNKKDYINATHTICENTFSKRADSKMWESFDYTCEYCNFLKELFDKSNGTVSLIGKYVDKKTVTRFICNIHNIEWDSTPTNQLKHNYCTMCSTNKLKTKERFQIELSKACEDLILQSEYTGTHNYVTVKNIKCGHTFNRVAKLLLEGHILCPECKKDGKIKSTRAKEHDVFINEMNDINPNILILSKYIRSNIHVECKCKICEYVWSAYPSNLLRGKGCPICANSKYAPCKYEQSVAYLYPYFADLFKNKEDAYVYKPNSTKKAVLCCPLCCTEREMSIRALCKYGFNCRFCGDHVSYPNKFSRALLSQLPVTNVEYEYSPDWIKPKAFDNYFEYKGKKYILEMDGALGHGNKLFGGKIDDTKGLKIDLYKDEQAKLHDIHVIRIKSLESNRDYLKNEFLNSEFSSIFDLSNIDWNECARFATKNIIKETADYYMENKNVMTLKEMASHFHIKYMNYRLSVAASLGWCDYKANSHRGIPITVTYNDTDLHFLSKSECAKYIIKYYKLNITESAIFIHFKKEKRYKDFILKEL